MPCGATQDGWVTVERSDRMWSTGEGNGKLQYSCLENPMNSMKRQNDRILKEDLPRSVGTQYATRDQWRNNSRKNEGMEPKQKQQDYQFSSVAQSCPTICNPTNHSTPGLPVHHHLLEFSQSHIHRVGDATQPSHPLSSPFPPAPNPSQHSESFPMSQLFA